ncbi:MAG: outer membrane protein assembly factor BamA, partial [Deltaproteobacteria bacterium]|nr:outer membrane protein assembly factor BamA [Deltaproteobacteria bacterium]
MFRKLSLFIIALLCFCPKTARPMDSVRVMVLPFEIHAIGDLSYLKEEILAVITNHLKQEGAAILAPGTIPDFTSGETTESFDQIRNLGIKNGADYVVWGSFTLIGQQFSLDAKVIESFGESPPRVFIKEGQGIENLPGTVKQLVRDIGMKLFKREKVASVVIADNKRIEADAIKRVIKTKPGDIFLSKSLSEDLKAVYEMGYFDDIRIEAEDTPIGKNIIFRVKEKPTIRVIHIKGNKVYKEEKVKENLTIKTGSILNIPKIRRNVNRIEELYKEKNYHNVQIAYKMHPLEQNQVDLEFDIDEGEKVLIKNIIFEGNQAYTDKELKKYLKTREKGFLSWLTS